MMRNYPETVIEILDDDASYPDGVIEAVRTFALAGPWKGSTKSRKKRFLQLNQALASASGMDEPRLAFRCLDGKSSGASHYIPGNHRIVLMGRLSVVTFLHEFAHALGFDEQDACWWSINLFRLVFPKQYSRLIHVGHTLIRPETLARRVNSGSRSKTTRSKEMC